jgi:hypothetical protein
MADLWQDEGFGSGSGLTEGIGGDDDWDEGEESIETDVEDGFEDPEESEGEVSWDDEAGE